MNQPITDALNVRVSLYNAPGRAGSSKTPSRGGRAIKMRPRRQGAAGNGIVGQALSSQGSSHHDETRRIECVMHKPEAVNPQATVAASICNTMSDTVLQYHPCGLPVIRRIEIKLLPAPKSHRRYWVRLYIEARQWQRGLPQDYKGTRIALAEYIKSLRHNWAIERRFPSTHVSINT